MGRGKCNDDRGVEDFDDVRRGVMAIYSSEGLYAPPEGEAGEEVVTVGRSSHSTAV